MNDQNRVLSRRGARQLNEQETRQVTGALGTLTVCSVDGNGHHDGDIGECS
jgi:hypothetical protein